MIKSFHTVHVRRIGLVLALGLFLLTLVQFATPRALSSAAGQNDDSTLLDGYRHVEVASVSDAIEKISGQRISSPRKRAAMPRSVSPSSTT